MTVTIEYNTISWDLSGNYDSSGTYINGDPWVSISTSENVVGISPEVVLAALDQDLNGSQYDLHWTKNLHSGVKNGFHGASANPLNDTSTGYSRLANVAIVNGSATSPINPLNVSTPVSLISCESNLFSGILQDGSSSNRTQIKQQAILTFTSSTPVAGSFRPSYSIDSKDSLITSADINYNNLANVQGSSVSGFLGATTGSLLLSGLKYPMLAYGNQGYGTFKTDGFNNIFCDGYGIYTANIQNMALAYINTNLPTQTEKIDIANCLIQRGVDILGSIEQAIPTSGTDAEGLTLWYGGQGGHQNSFEAPLIFLAAMLNPGSVRTRVKEILELSQTVVADGKNPMFQIDQQLVQVDESTIAASELWFSGVPGVSSSAEALDTSSHIVYQTSDIGQYDWRMSESYHKKSWTEVETEYAASSHSQWSSASGELVLYQGYRHCCTAAFWVPMLFAFKAMGVEELIWNPARALYTERFIRKNDYGPFPESASGDYTSLSTEMRQIIGSSTVETTSSLSTSGAKVLYDENVRHSFLDSKSAGTNLAATPVSGIQSFGISTFPETYLEASGGISAAATTTIMCHGMDGFDPQDFMTLFLFSSTNILENPNRILDVDLYSYVYTSFQNITLATGASTGYADITPVGGTEGQEYFLQAVLARIVNGEIELRTTNGLKVVIQ